MTDTHICSECAEKIAFAASDRWEAEQIIEGERSHARRALVLAEKDAQKAAKAQGSRPC